MLSWVNGRLLRSLGVRSTTTGGCMRHTSVIITVALGLVMLAGAADPAGAAVDTSRAIEATVLDAVTHYLEVRADAALSGGNVRALRRCFVAGHSATEEYMAAGHRAFHEGMGDYAAASAVNVVDADVDVRDGDHAVVVVTAQTTTDFSAASRRSCGDGEVTQHTIALVKQPDGTWRIASDEYPAEGMATYLDAAGAPAALVAAAREEQQAELEVEVAAAAQSLGSDDVAASDMRGTAIQDAGDVIPQYVTIAYYDRAAAVAYAKKWWNSRNSYYNNYSNSGGDCANFVSQCTYAGGMWKFGGSSNPLGQQWWFHHSTMTDSQSWRYCPTQVDAWKWTQPGKSPGRYVISLHVSKPSGYSKGDVAWLTNSSGNETHALICTGFSGSTPLFSCHSQNHWNEPLSYWGGTHKFGVVANQWTIL